MILIISCGERDEEGIYGHWHIYTKNLDDRSYFTLDVIPDENPLIGKFSLFGTIEGEHDPNSSKLIFPGECGVGKFSYTIKEDTVFLKTDLSLTYGLKCSDGCCDLISDIKDETRINIELREIDTSRFEAITLDENYYIFKNIFYGFVENDPSYSPNTRKMELENKFCVIQDIPYWIMEIKKRDSFPINRIVYRIFTDQQAKLNDIQLIVKELEDSGIDKIFLTFMSSNYLYSNHKFSYYKVKSSILKSRSKIFRDEK